MNSINNLTIDGIRPTGETRTYISQMLKRTYGNPNIPVNDQLPLSSLAMSLEDFLVNMEIKNGEEAARKLLKNLQEIADEGLRLNAGTAGAEHIQTGKKLVTEDGKILYLGPLLGEGGEGRVFKTPGMPGKAVKIYRSNVDRKERERKIKALMRTHVPAQVEHMQIATVPEACVYTQSGEFVGYIMQQVSSRFKIYDVMRNSPERVKFFPELDYRGLIVIAYNVAEIVNIFHEHDVVLGDLNLSNIVTNIDGTVCFIDIDSCDVTDPETGERFFCTVGMPELLAPEIHAALHIQGMCSKETDNFALGVIIFQLLMNNFHPFVAANTDYMYSADLGTQNRAIINGECPYVRTLKNKKIPDAAPDFSLFPDKMRELFDRVFHYTAATYQEKIQQRPNPKEWMDALLEFYQTPMCQCEKNGFFWYRKDLQHCPFCKE